MRTRRLPLAVLAALALLASTAACGAGDEASADEVRSSVDRAPTSAADAADGGAVVRHVGTGLYATLAEAAGDENLAYSPASIAQALGMTRAGATGESADQLDAFLGTADPAELHTALNGLSTVLAERAGDRRTSKDQDAEISLSSANSLWGQDGVEWQDPFLDTLARDYGIGIHTVDYEGDTAGARQAINGWVADETRDEIPDLLPDGVLTARTRLSLVNALYLAAPWDDPLDLRGTASFTTAAGDEVDAEMMGATAAYPAHQGDGWTAVTLPYAGRELALTLLVPDAGRFADVEAALDDDLLGEVLTDGTETTLDVTFPLFDLDSRPDLTAALQAVGVTAPFETDADFDPMTVDPEAAPLRLAAVVHQATVAVDEEGTVAAAATGAVFEQVGAAITDDELVVDRPFLFVIHDLETATPLFLGRVTDPTRP